jgi:predicted RNase H-like HicB family nuclease
MTPEEHLAVPYVMVMESIERPDGDWVRQASYPELPGCIAQAATPIEAIDRLEEQRVSYILERLQEGRPVPVPRPPLKHGSEGLRLERLEFAKWLKDTKRISDHHTKGSTRKPAK